MEFHINLIETFPESNYIEWMLEKFDDTNPVTMLHGRIAMSDERF